MNAKNYLKKIYYKLHFAPIKIAIKLSIIFARLVLLRPFLKQSKIAKYRSKKYELYLRFKYSLKNLKEFRCRFRQSLHFIESREFIAKYANHPYPPLLNPQNLDYKNISAKLAWELNLPLPSNYNLIYIRIYACASGSMPVYLRKCGFYLTSSFQDDGFDTYATYLKIYDELNCNGGGAKYRAGFACA